MQFFNSPYQKTLKSTPNWEFSPYCFSVLQWSLYWKIHKINQTNQPNEQKQMLWWGQIVLQVSNDQRVQGLNYNSWDLVPTCCTLPALPSETNKRENPWQRTAGLLTKPLNRKEEATHSRPKLMAGCVGTKAQEKTAGGKRAHALKRDWNREMAVTNRDEELISQG